MEETILAKGWQKQQDCLWDWLREKEQHFLEGWLRQQKELESYLCTCISDWHIIMQVPLQTLSTTEGTQCRKYHDIWITDCLIIAPNYGQYSLLHAYINSRYHAGSSPSVSQTWERCYSFHSAFSTKIQPVNQMI